MKYRLVQRYVVELFSDDETPIITLDHIENYGPMTTKGEAHAYVKSKYPTATFEDDDDNLGEAPTHPIRRSD